MFLFFFFFGFHFIILFWSSFYLSSFLLEFLHGHSSKPIHHCYFSFSSIFCPGTLHDPTLVQLTNFCRLTDSCELWTDKSLSSPEFQICQANLSQCPKGCKINCPGQLSFLYFCLSMRHHHLHGWILWYETLLPPLTFMQSNTLLILKWEWNLLFL